MSHFRNFIIICLSLLTVALSGVALRLIPSSAVDTVYADSYIQPVELKGNMTLANSLKERPAGQPAIEPEIIALINASPAQASQYLGSPLGLPSTQLPTAWSIVDLDATSSLNGHSWQAIVTVTVIDGAGNPVTRANIFGSWGDSQIVSCTTNATGRCILTSPKVEANQIKQLTFTVNNMTHSEPSHYIYQSTRNIDPDGDSDGTTIVINQP